MRPVRPVRLTSFVDVPRFFGRKSLRPTFPVILAQWQTPSQKALASVTAPVMRTAKKKVNINKQTKNIEKKHKTKLKTLIAHVTVVSASFMQNGRGARDARRRAKN